LTKKSQHTTPHSALQNDRKSTRDVYPKSRFYFSFFESTCKHTHPHYRPCTQSPGLKLQINRAMPKGKLGPSATPWGLAMGTTRTPKPASPPLQSVKHLRPPLDIASGQRMSSFETLTQKWLRQNISAYNDGNRVFADIDATLSLYPTLRPKTDVYSSVSCLEQSRTVYSSLPFSSSL
jgi:hypothetical protein